MAVTFLTNEDKNIIDEQIAELQNGGSGSVAVDATLTQEGMAADAKATGDAIASLNEEMVKSVEGFTADANGDVQIRYPIDTIMGYRHSGISDKEKAVTVYADERYANAPHIFYGENYWPETEYLARYNQHGLTYNNDGNNISVKGTATAGSSFLLSATDGGDEYWSLPEGLAAGDVMMLYVFSSPSATDCPGVNVAFFDSNNTWLATIAAKIGANATSATASKAIPEGAAKVRFELSYKTGQAYDNLVFPVLVKKTVEMTNDLPFEGGVLTVDTVSDSLVVCTAPYKSVITHSVGLKEYIDGGSSNIDIEMIEAMQKKSFITPEEFGAFANGTKDDTAALQACIDFAVENRKKVIGGGTYLTSAPLFISADRVDIDLYSITYTGEESAVVVTGSNNNIRIADIYSPNGVGFRISASNPSYYNKIYLGKVFSAKNAVEYIAQTNNLCYNSMTFSRLVCGAEYVCIYHSPDLIGLPSETNWHNNNNFTGGKLEGGRWGVYNAKAQDTYMTCAFENIDNCFHQNGIGKIRIIAPRVVEIIGESVDKNDPARPIIEGKGIVYCGDIPNYENFQTDGAVDCQFTLDAPSSGLYVTNIDVSKIPTTCTKLETGEVLPVSKGQHSPTTINASLYTRQGGIIAHSFMLYMNHILVKEPAYRATKQVIANEQGYSGDYRLTGDDNGEFFIYETFRISENGCDYTLPPSYDNIAFKQFYVEQSENTDCIFRDWRETVIFNGAEYGAGMYEVTAKVKTLAQGDRYDNRNQIWEIRRMSDYSLVDTMPHEVETTE